MIVKMLKTFVVARSSQQDRLLEALRDFGTRDVETLPVEVGTGANRRLIGLLLRSDVMRRYSKEVLAKH